MENSAGLIKWLASQGFRNRTICLITGCKQPYVSKVVQGKLRAQEEASDKMTDEQAKRFDIMQKLWQLDAIQDAEYQAVVHMKLLKYSGWSVDEIYEKYDFYSRRRFEFLYKNTSIQLIDFDSERYLHIPFFEFRKFIRV